jgi:hypothetical protein
MTKPDRLYSGAPDAGKPQIYDKAPPQWTGVPTERDPVSGRLLSGDPLGRGDKGRSARSPGKTALITAGAGAAVAAVVITAVVVTGGGDPTASAGGVQTSEQTTSAVPTTTTPTVETGPREVPVTFTTTVVTPPPGFGQDPAQGTVGEVLTFTWTITGPCDGAGPCDIEQCDASGCGSPFPGEPQGSGYVARFTNPIPWNGPGCPAGSLEDTVTWTVTGDGDDISVTGSWVQQAAQVLFTGTDGSQCGLYLREWSIASD